MCLLTDKAFFCFCAFADTRRNWTEGAAEQNTTRRMCQKRVVRVMQMTTRGRAENSWSHKHRWMVVVVVAVVMDVVVIAAKDWPVNGLAE